MLQNRLPMYCVQPVPLSDRFFSEFSCSSAQNLHFSHTSRAFSAHCRSVGFMHWTTPLCGWCFVRGALSLENCSAGIYREDDLNTFEDGWYQAVDAATPPNELAMWRGLFDEAREGSLASPKVGLMKLRAVPGEHRYAVAVREGSNLWLTDWVRRSRKGEFFVMVPRADRDWDPHTSYHLNGTLHMKSYDYKLGSPQKRQPLTGAFRGTEHLGMFMGHGPKSVGAVCDTTAFLSCRSCAWGVGAAQRRGYS